MDGSAIFCEARGAIGDRCHTPTIWGVLGWFCICSAYSRLSVLFRSQSVIHIAPPRLAIDFDSYREIRFIWSLNLFLKGPSSKGIHLRRTSLGSVKKFPRRILRQLELPHLHSRGASHFSHAFKK